MVRDPKMTGGRRIQKSLISQLLQYVFWELLLEHFFLKEYLLAEIEFRNNILYLMSSL